MPAFDSRARTARRATATQEGDRMKPEKREHEPRTDWSASTNSTSACAPLVTRPMATSASRAGNGSIAERIAYAGAPALEKLRLADCKPQSRRKSCAASPSGDVRQSRESLWTVDQLVLFPAACAFSIAVRMWRRRRSACRRAGAGGRC
jgi:hypothetical protein